MKKEKTLKENSDKKQCPSCFGNDDSCEVCNGTGIVKDLVEKELEVEIEEEK